MTGTRRAPDASALRRARAVQTPPFTAAAALLLLLCAATIAQAQQQQAVSQPAANDAPSRALAPTPAGAAPQPATPPAQQPAPALPFGHKTLVPILPRDGAMFAVIAVALFVASGAGVGGGVLMVPALLLIGGFSAIIAVALSNVTILASSIANVAFNAPRRSPVKAAGPLIDWDLVLLFGPPTVVGSIAGSYINMVIPSWVTKVLLFVLLLPMTWRTVDKARGLYRKETAARKQQQQQQQQEEGQQADCARGLCSPGKASRPPLLVTAEAAATASGGGGEEAGAARAGGPASAVVSPRGVTHGASLGRTSITSSVADTFGPDLAFVEGTGGGHAAAAAAEGGDVERGGAAAPEAEGPPLSPAGSSAAPTAALPCPGCPGALRRWVRHRWPPPAECPSATCAAARRRIEREEARQLPPLQVSLLGAILLSVAATSIPGGFLIPCGTAPYWVVSLSPLAAMLLVWAAVRGHVLWKAKWKAALGMAAPGDLKWDSRATVVYPAICISAGIIAGLLGLGGGLVLAPLMLELGVHPAVSAASTQVTLLISSFTSAVVYAVNDSVPWDYGGILIAIGLAATLTGQWAVAALVKRLGRPSVLVVVLAAMFAASTGAAAAVVAITAAGLARHPERLAARKGVCPTFQ